jgi:hypothetical protein
MHFLSVRVSDIGGRVADRLVLDMQDEHDGDASGFADAALLAVDPDDVAASVVLDRVAVNDSIFWNTISTELNLPPGLVPERASVRRPRRLPLAGYSSTAQLPSASQARGSV